MANHKSAEKYALQSKKRAENNKRHKTELRTYVKKLRQAIEAKDKETALKLFPLVQKKASQLKTKGVLKANNAARKTSRMALKLNSLLQLQA